MYYLSEKTDLNSGGCICVFVKTCCKKGFAHIYKTWLKFKNEFWKKHQVVVTVLLMIMLHHMCELHVKTRIIP